MLVEGTTLQHNPSVQALFCGLQSTQKMARLQLFKGLSNSFAQEFVMHSPSPAYPANCQVVRMCQMPNLLDLTAAAVKMLALASEVAIIHNLH